MGLEPGQLLAIHASHGEFARSDCPAAWAARDRHFADPWRVTHGYVLAVCRVLAVVRVEGRNSTRAGEPTVVAGDLRALARAIDGREAHERQMGDWSPGRWLYVLGEMRALARPVAARGYQGVWKMTAADLEERA